MRLEMRQRASERRRNLAFDGERQRFDVAALTFRCRGAATSFARQRRLLPRDVALLIEGVDAGAGDMGQRKFRIGRDRALERFRRAWPSRQQQVDAVAIGGGRLR